MHTTPALGLQYGGTIYDGGNTKVHARNMGKLIDGLATLAESAGLTPLTGYTASNFAWDGGMEREAEKNLNLVVAQLTAVQTAIGATKTLGIKTNFRATDGGQNRIMTQNLLTIDGEVARLTALIVGPLQELTNLTAVAQANDDIVFAWEGREGKTDFYLENIDVTNSQVAATATGSGRSWTFTRDAQVAMYGFPATFANFRVCEYIPVGAVKGPFAEYAAAVTPAV